MTNPATSPRAGGTGTDATRVLGLVTLAGVAWLILFGLFLSPADKNQGESVRILYLHAPSAWIAYLAFVVTAARLGACTCSASSTR